MVLEESQEKGKEYVLVKNDGVEGGWALGVVSNREGQRNKPIDVEQFGQQVKCEDDDVGEWEDEGDGFEDVPIEGLNRLPSHQRAFWQQTLMIKLSRKKFSGEGVRCMKHAREEMARRRKL
jgi:hypothetical protein